MVGAGHLPGMRECWNADIDYAEIVSMPPGAAAQVKELQAGSVVTWRRARAAQPQQHRPHSGGRAVAGAAVVPNPKGHREEGRGRLTQRTAACQGCSCWLRHQLQLAAPPLCAD